MSMVLPADVEVMVTVEEPGVKFELMIKLPEQLSCLTSVTVAVAASKLPMILNGPEPEKFVVLKEFASVVRVCSNVPVRLTTDVPRVMVISVRSIAPVQLRVLSLRYTSKVPVIVPA